MDDSIKIAEVFALNFTEASYPLRERSRHRELP